MCKGSECMENTFDAVLMGKSSGSGSYRRWDDNMKLLG